MRIAIIFVLVVMFHNDAYAEKSTTTLPEGFVLDKRQKIVARPTVAKVVSDVLLGHKVVRPSMMPSNIADRLHHLNEIDMRASSTNGIINSPEYQRGHRDGQIAAILGLLYTTGLIPNPQFKTDRASLYYNRHVLPSRLRALATVLLLTNYKEPKPLPPSNIVQLAIPGK